MLEMYGLPRVTARPEVLFLSPVVAPSLAVVAA
jgi:hypothetical protein